MPQQQVVIIIKQIPNKEMKMMINIALQFLPPGGPVDPTTVAAAAGIIAV